MTENKEITPEEMTPEEIQEEENAIHERMEKKEHVMRMIREDTSRESAQRLELLRRTEKMQDEMIETRKRILKNLEDSRKRLL